MPWGLVICIAIAIVVSIGVAYEVYYGFDLGGTVLMAALFSLLGFCIWILIGVFSLADAEPVKQIPMEDRAIEIYSLADGNLVEGYTGSFLGSGYINEELKYTFVKEDALGYTVEQVDADKCYVKYTKDTPKAVPLKNHYSGWINFWNGSDKTEEEGYIFYLPEGTIVQEYNIDLK